MAEQSADRDYGYSGRKVQEGEYSGAYGRGMAGETDAPSAGGAVGAGYRNGGADIPAPDYEDGPVTGEPPEGEGEGEGDRDRNAP